MLRQTIISYDPKNEQEHVDKEAILNFIDRNDDCLYRSNKIAHITSSAIVVNSSMHKVLFAFHNIYQSYGWVGGHNDGDPDCLNVAIKETKEETGLNTVSPHSNHPFMLDIIHVQNHYKNGEYVPDHLHLNVTYLLIADEKDSLRIKPDENSAVKWFLIDEVLEYVKEARMKPIYQKAFQYIASLKS